MPGRFLGKDYSIFMILTLLISFVVVAAFLATVLLRPESKAVIPFGVVGALLLFYLLLVFLPYIS
jgi:hypothetical protein